MKKIIIILFAIIAIGGSLKAQVTISLYPYKYSVGTQSSIIAYRIYQSNKFGNGQNNEPVQTDYYHYKHICPLELSTLTNVKKIVVRIEPFAVEDHAFYNIVKTINVLDEDGIIKYELDGVKREIKNNRILVDGEITANKRLCSSPNNISSFKYYITVYNSSDNLIGTREYTYNATFKLIYSYDF